ncbi:NAD(P)-binding protein [Leucogyrophana mollusca]|uniref:NAD(P)-binding protein n=1 Tax=Leucogyrophana mollusca TaxID=85980 RepID=A0ACB8B3A7_9AGAM|nr:NAD(P)-binding protein [Leucogyrophana mollusca]
MTDELILVTGAAGFLASHVVHQLLEKGYRVRGTARGAKLQLLKEGYASYGDRFEAVVIQDVAVDDITEQLKGVTAVIHTAAPLPSKGSVEVVLDGSIEGSLNVIKQADKAGIKKVVFTSSILAALNPTLPLTDKDWNPVTKEEAIQSNDSFVAYSAAKTYAERAVWQYAEEHKTIDITTVLPPFLYGPLAPGFKIPAPDFVTLSTDLYIYQMLTPNGKFPAFSAYMDVRDTARVHVEALTSPPDSAVGHKRLLLSSPHELSYKEALELIAVKRPELKDRLVSVSKMPQYPFTKLDVDLKRVEQVTGVKPTSYYSWQETILDAVDALIAVEKDWKNKGHDFTIPA